MKYSISDHIVSQVDIDEMFGVFIRLGFFFSLLLEQIKLYRKIM